MFTACHGNARKYPCSQCAWTFCCQKAPTPRWSSHGCSASSSYLLDPAKLLLETATATAVGSSINPEGVLTLSWVKRSSKTRRLSEDYCIRILSVNMFMDASANQLESPWTDQARSIAHGPILSPDGTRGRSFPSSYQKHLESILWILWVLQLVA